MEKEISNTSKIALDKVYAASSRYVLPDDEENLAKLVAVLGEMSREEYLSLRAEWKARYASVSVESRQTKPLRKGGNTKATDRCSELRYEARRLMSVRHALKECARRHASTSRAVAA